MNIYNMEYFITSLQGKIRKTRRVMKFVEIYTLENILLRHGTNTFFIFAYSG